MVESLESQNKVIDWLVPMILDEKHTWVRGRCQRYEVPSKVTKVLIKVHDLPREVINLLVKPSRIMQTVASCQQGSIEPSHLHAWTL